MYIPSIGGDNLIRGVSFQVGSFSNLSNLSKANSALKKSTEKLASGTKSSSKDAATISAIESLISKAKGIDAASKNISDSISLVQTADAGLSSINNHLQDIRSLTVQAKNGALSTDEVSAIQGEINIKLANISGIADAAAHNDVQLLDGTKGAISIQSGHEDGSTTEIDLAGDFSADAANIDGSLNHGNTGGSAGVAINDIDVTTGDLDHIITGIDNAIQNVSDARSSFGSKETNLTAKLETLSVKKEAVLASKSKLSDTNYAAEASVLLRSMFQRQGAAALSSQSTVDSRLALNLLPVLG